jgi:hypothetical protein
MVSLGNLWRAMRKLRRFFELSRFFKLSPFLAGVRGPCRCTRRRAGEGASARNTLRVKLVLAISDAGITRHTPLKQKLAPTSGSLFEWRNRLARALALLLFLAPNQEVYPPSLRSPRGLKARQRGCTYTRPL